MADRRHTESGRSVEVIRLTCTPNRRDGEWLRVRYLCYWIADVRQLAELALWFALAELQEALARR